MPLRHQRPFARWRSALHRRQSPSSAEPGRDLRQGCVGHHEAVFARAADAAVAAQSGRRTRRGGIRTHQLGRSVSRDGRAPRAPARYRSEKIRAVHRTRSDASVDRPIRGPVRHTQLRRARRFLLGEYGRRHDLHHRRLVLGIRRPRSGAREAFCDDRHGGRPSLQSAQNCNFQIQTQRWQIYFHQPGAYGLLGNCRRMDTHTPRHRWRAAAGIVRRADPPRFI